MIVYTYSEAREKLATLLDQAAREGEVKITRRDGQTFIIRPEKKAGSPLDVEGLDLGLTAAEIVECVREGRRVYEPAQDELPSPQPAPAGQGSAPNLS